ncbi:TetR/AcrR family transcriptional regulator [Streptomyces sp. NPDC006872]|uniref:TetR/AcrR family transcriptional regulator n=1 Tax=Streptomyces sp. NPDC006872 TaxID=3155720 RepID=UPI0033CB6CAF
MTKPQATRTQRANGALSRQRILDAAVEIAGERGYEGTSIAAVSAKCGLPASSIYWHFKDKDDLIAAVVERGFTTWLAALESPGTAQGTAQGTAPGAAPGTPLEQVGFMAANVARTLVAAPDFLRLGLMLALVRCPAERRGRTVFLQVRDIACRKTTEFIRTLFPDLDERAVRDLATYAMAGADGLFLQRELTGDSADLVEMLQLHARLVHDAAARMAARSRARPAPRTG